MARAFQTRRHLLVVYDADNGLFTYRVRGAAFQDSLARCGWQVEFVSYRHHNRDQLRKEVALFSRQFDLVYLLKIPSSLDLIREIHRFSAARVVFDLTDALWLPLFREHGWQQIDEILAESDAIFCCNRYDKAYARQKNSRVFCVPPYADLAKFDEALAAAKPRAAIPVVIGWVGSNSTVSGLHNIAPALARVAELNQEVILRVVGCTDPKQLPVFTRLRVSLGPGVYDEDVMIQEIIQMDLGVFPIVTDEEEFQIRGPLKALNYMSGIIPVVCHNAGECTNLIKDGESGMLACTQEEWAGKISRLVRDPVLRREMGLRGHAIVRDRFSKESVFEILETSLQSVLNQSVSRSLVAAALRATGLRFFRKMKAFRLGASKARVLPENG